MSDQRLTLPRITNESQEDYLRRIAIKAVEKAKASQGSNEMGQRVTTPSITTGKGHDMSHPPPKPHFGGSYPEEELVTSQESGAFPVVMKEYPKGFKRPDDWPSQDQMLKDLEKRILKRKWWQRKPKSDAVEH